jgi:hypothetical protein
MNNQEIIDNAPPNTSIVDSEFNFFNDIYCHLNSDGQWNWTNKMPKYPIRSLADIKRIVELEKALDKLIDRAQQVDSWESFPESWLDEAYEALKEHKL